MRYKTAQYFNTYVILGFQTMLQITYKYDKRKKKDKKRGYKITISITEIHHSACLSTQIPCCKIMLFSK